MVEQTPKEKSVAANPLQSIPYATLSGEAVLKALEEASVGLGISDIHFSPQKTDVRLECRLHGVLRSVAFLTPAQYGDILRRIKFVAKLKLNITTVAQDGQYVIPMNNRVVNIRAATLPSRFGEAVTLRFLDPDRGILPLEKLGFPEDIIKSLRELVELPNGLVLVTGPTGSGKTTTLYALLSTIVGKERNIITLEDPVEYELPGIIQSQIDPEHNFTFANGLRSVLRHDPDVILVGEIRDVETAQTAINAALTGHLVLSTLPTNSAVEAIPRLLSMGVSPYTFAPAIRAVLAQRLVRTLKPNCRGAAKCDPASHDSYGGQMCVPELLHVTPALQTLILDMAQGPKILEQAKKDGFKTMKEWGEDFIKKGLTTKGEVERVTA